MNLALVVPVCLHCGELGAEGALFCPKCGYTLPQSGGAPAAAPPPVAPPTPRSGPATPYPAATWGPVVPPGAYAAPSASVPGAVGAIPPPPSAKYCVRCASLISAPAVYCPICQQPQP